MSNMLMINDILVFFKGPAISLYGSNFIIYLLNSNAISLKLFCNVNISLNHLGFLIHENKLNFSVLKYRGYFFMLLSFYSM